MNTETPEAKLYRLILADLDAQTKMMRNFESQVTPAILRLDADVAKLKTDVAILKTDMAELKTDVSDLKASVGRIETLLSNRNNGSSSSGGS